MEPVTRARSHLRHSAAGRIALALMLLGYLFGSAANEVPEYQVKAVFLLNFTKFIEWPATAFAASDSPIAICVVGEDPFGKVLDQILAGEVVNGRRVVAERIKSVAEAKSCQVLFVPKTEKDPAKSLSGLGPGVLTVGEGQSFLRGGGVIAFVVENRRVRFGVNEGAAANAGLVVSSKLLNIAKSVEKE
jgi:YfiR/HmsC-like